MKQILLTLLTICVTSAYAQTITVDFPFHSNRQVILWLKNGTKNDTIFRGAFDEKGHVVIPILQNNPDYRGIAVIQPDYPNAYFEFIVAGENITLKCDEEYPHGGNTVFIGSPENDALQKWFSDQAIRQQKIVLFDNLKQLYDKEELLPLFDQEKQQLETTQAAFEQELKNSPLYAAKLIQLYNFLNVKVSNLVFADIFKMIEVRNYATDSLDVEALFHSGLWFNVLNGLLAIYGNDKPFHTYFAADMSSLLKRTRSDKTYVSLAENVFEICEAMGWNDMEEQLAYFLINDGRIKEPQGKIKMLMTLYKLSKGNKAPLLTQRKNKKISTPTLLIFYETGCGNCENEIQQLKENYSLLKEKGYSVISVSADTDVEVFNNTSESFPWKEKYCDLQGFSGLDFQNYGIIGTPTFFVIDKNGVVQGRYARLIDTKISDHGE